MCKFSRLIQTVTDDEADNISAKSLTSGNALIARQGRCDCNSSSECVLDATAVPKHGSA